MLPSVSVASSVTVCVPAAVADREHRHACLGVVVPELALAIRAPDQLDERRVILAIADTRHKVDGVAVSGIAVGRTRDGHLGRRVEVGVRIGVSIRICIRIRISVGIDVESKPAVSLAESSLAQATPRRLTRREIFSGLCMRHLRGGLRCYRFTSPRTGWG